MTSGYGVEPDELKKHANDVRDVVGDRVSEAQHAAGYESGFAEMGILGFVITQMIDMKDDTDRMIMLAREFLDDLTDRVEHAGDTYEDIEDGHIELLHRIEQIELEQQNDQNPRGPRTL